MHEVTHPRDENEMEALNPFSLPLLDLPKPQNLHTTGDDLTEKLKRRACGVSCRRNPISSKVHFIIRLLEDSHKLKAT